MQGQGGVGWGDTVGRSSLQKKRSAADKEDLIILLEQVESQDAGING